MEVLGVADDVVVGDDVALFVEHHTRTTALVSGDLYDRGQHPLDHSLVIVLQPRAVLGNGDPAGVGWPPLAGQARSKPDRRAGHRQRRRADRLPLPRQCDADAESPPTVENA
ncbi:MAG TPA: hypothetical protein VGD73_06235 [Pseudonocardia sp.]|jgi:hypothetical protein|uniref:hypothetical protein n=1 Tax=Pseudonocardia sp. TaxID=60912 RepID=UPI002EDA17AC